MARRYRAHSLNFKRQIAQEFLSGVFSMHAIARRHDISRTLIARWTQQYATGELAGLSAAEVERRELEGRVALLERKLGQLTLENELLKKTLPRSRPLTAERSSLVSGPAASALPEDVD